VGVNEHPKTIKKILPNRGPKRKIRRKEDNVLLFKEIAEQMKTRRSGIQWKNRYQQMKEPEKIVGFK